LKLGYLQIAGVEFTTNKKKTDERERNKESIMREKWQR